MKLADYRIVIAILIGLATLVGVGMKADGRYAKTYKLQLVSQRLDLKILEDRVAALQERMWRLLDRYGSVSQMPPAVRDEYRRHEAEMKQRQEELRRR